MVNVLMHKLDFTLFLCLKINEPCKGIEFNILKNKLSYVSNHFHKYNISNIIYRNGFTCLSMYVENYEDFIMVNISDSCNCSIINIILSAWGCVLKVPDSCGRAVCHGP